MALMLDLTTIVAIVVAAVLNMLIGGAWYARPVFGRRWMAAVGITEEQAQKSWRRAFAGAFVAALVTSAVLALFLDFANATTVLGGAIVGFWVWLGFLATSAAASALFEQRKASFYGIVAGNHLVTLLVMGAVLGLLLGPSLG